MTGKGTWICHLCCNFASSVSQPVFELRLMSFGRPPSISTGFQVTPPNRGSFPLDHYGLYRYRAETHVLALKLVFLGECKAFMTQYLECLKRNSSTSSECRHLNRDYLECRMKKYVFCVDVNRVHAKDVGQWAHGERRMEKSRIIQSQG